MKRTRSENQTGLIILTMIPLHTTVFAQTGDWRTEKAKAGKVTNSYKQTALRKITATLFTILVFSTLTINAFSQQTYLDPLLNTVTTNFNYGTSHNSLKYYKKGVWGAQVGTSFQAGITPGFSLVPEFYFVMKGGQLKENNSLTTNKSILRLYTLELPVLARVHFSKVYLNAGPYMAYTLFGTMKVEGSADLSETSTALLFDKSAKAFKRWDTGIQIGGGYMFYLKKHDLPWICGTVTG